VLQVALKAGNQLNQCVLCICSIQH
jgi:hypothetical protein